MSFKTFTRNVRISTTIGLWICTLSAIGLYVASFCVPPMGTIDSSILKAGSWLFAFAGLFEAREAIREGLGFKLQHGETTVEVRDADPENPKPENTENNES